VLIVLSAGIAAVVVFSQSVPAGLIALTDGILATCIVVSACSAGLWIVAALGLGGVPIRWQIMLGAAAGIGALGTLVLGFGLLGWLNRWLWFGLLAAGLLAGLVRVATWLPQAKTRSAPPYTMFRWLWLLAMPFLGFAVLAATIPPGMPWGEEAAGYDVLEYHLAVPKEYLQAGRVHFLAHNVYSNFPSNAEMLYLLAMVLRADPYAGAPVAKLANLWLAILTVAAAWLAGREYGQHTGILAGVLAAACPWLAYLSGVAYVENGMLFFGMMAMAAIGRFAEADGATRGRWRWALAAGMLAGWSCGFKYLAVPMFAVPVVLGVTLTAYRRRLRSGRPGGSLGWLRGPALALIGAGLTASPWLVKNAVNTGDPVFPLGYRVFGAKAGVWNDQLAARWERAHRPTPQEEPWCSRLEILLRRIVVEPRLGLMTILLAPLILVSPQRRLFDAVCALTVVIQVLVWLTATHLYARFAVVVIVPLTLLAARAVLVGDWGPVRLGVVGLVVAGAGANLYHLGGLYYDHSHDALGRRFDPHAVSLEMLRRINPVNVHTPPGATVWLVGEARTFYVDRRCYYHVVFNDDPLAERIRRCKDPAEAVEWLQAVGVTHVYVDWSEVRRLQRTYGFWPELTGPVFARLERAGLRRLTGKSGGRMPWVEVFEVP